MIAIIAALLAILAVSSILNVVTGFILNQTFKRYANSSGENIDPEIEDDVQYSLINDLMKYCNEKGLNAFIDTSSDSLSLSTEKEDNNVEKILELKFPIDKVGSQEYLVCLERQKEQIDNYLKGVNNAKAE